MTDAETAYAAAEVAIAQAKAEGAERLFLRGVFNNTFEALDRLPPEIAGLTRLTRLDLWHAKVSDLSPVAGLAGLTMLNLAGTAVTDLSPAAGLARLTALYLSRTAVTDLSPVAGLAGLTMLNLAGTGGGRSADDTGTAEAG